VTVAIEARGLGKEYRLGSRMPAYRTLRDAFADRLRLAHRPQETVSALNDVSFEIERGEAIGVIGANGAGKTTLLKILSRVTDPSEGEALVRGRVGSLLEVGTGFHPELTGRENIFLNGAILGMRRSEIKTRFDEIVSFAEVERFIDTPVKRYSSGMYVRLAFAVAAYLEADILLVDEVLSVGDLAFQRKCLGKMQDQTSAEGRTVLFVSHNLASIKLLTTRCLWLERGRLREVGPTEEIFRGYLLSHESEGGTGHADLSNLDERRKVSGELDQRVTFEWIELRDPEGNVTDAHIEGDPLRVRVGIRCSRAIDDELEFLARVHTIENVVVASVLSGRRRLALEEGVYETSFTLDPNPLRPGVYRFELYAVARIAQDLVPAAITFRIESSIRPGDDPRLAGPLDLGIVRLGASWDAIVPAQDIVRGLP
jgi:lipopolysaccharide transport system ATP-binding protein